MIECKVYWKNRKRTPDGWTPDDDHMLAKMVQRDMRVTGFIRDGIKVLIDEPDLAYFQERFEDLDFQKQ